MVMLFPSGGVVSSELLEQTALLVVQAGGKFHGDGNPLIAPSHRITQFGNALVLEGEHGIGLRARRNLQAGGAIHRLHLDRVTKDRLQVTHLHLRQHGEAIAPQRGVGLNGEEHVQIAGGATTEARVALTGDPQTRARVHTRRNIEGYSWLAAA